VFDFGPQIAALCFYHVKKLRDILIEENYAWIKVIKDKVQANFAGENLVDISGIIHDG